MVPMSTFKATFPDGKEAHQPSCPTCSNEGAYAMTAGGGESPCIFPARVVD